MLRIPQLERELSGNLSKSKKNDRKLEENIYTKQKKNKDIFTVNVMTMRENRENATNQQYVV